MLDVPLPSRPFPHGLDYSTAKRLTLALLSIQAAYKVAKSWTPDAAVAPASNSQMYPHNVKEMGVVDGAWSGFAHTLDALLEGLGLLEMFSDRSIYDKLIESGWAHLSAWLEALLNSAYPVMRSPAENKPGSGDDDIDF